MVRRATGPDEHCTVTEVTSGTVLLSVQGPSSRELLVAAFLGRSVQRGVPVPVGPDHRRRPRPGAGPAGHLPGRAGLRAARPHRVRAWGLRRPAWRRGPTSGSGRWAWRPWPGCGSRRATATWASTSTTPTTRSRRASASPSPSTSRAASSVGRPCSRYVTPLPTGSLLVSLLVEDPDVDLFGNEPVLLDGSWIGYVRAAAYGHTLGGPVGLAMVEHPGRRDPGVAGVDGLRGVDAARQPTRPAVGRDRSTTRRATRILAREDS